MWYRCVSAYYTELATKLFQILFEFYADTACVWSCLDLYNRICRRFSWYCHPFDNEFRACIVVPCFFMHFSTMLRICWMYSLSLKINLTVATPKMSISDSTLYSRVQKN